MKSKTVLGADGTTKMREITVGIHGKGGEVGIRAVQQLAGMVSSLKQCKTPQERAQGLAAGLELLKGCDFMIVGDKYGISEGMYREIETAKALRIPVINDAGLLVRAKHEKQRAERLAEEYAKRYACCFCRGRNLHTCNGYSCKEPYQRAYDYAMSKVAAGCMVVKIE